MIMLRLRYRVCCLTLLLIMASLAVAGGPLDSLVPFRSKVEADPKKNYQLTKSNGPWMIMAISLAGDDAEVKAQKVALELRRDHKLEAWVHEQEIDRGDTVIGLGVDKYNNPRKMKNMRGGATREVAVMVGNFNSADDPAATRTLEQVRSANIKALANGEVFSDNSGLNAIRSAYFNAAARAKAAARKSKPQTRGPLGRAFMTRNPLQPVEEVAQATIDPFVVELNRGVEYSLLDNPKQYTVVVGTFRGAAAFSEEKFAESVAKVRNKTQGDSPLDKATKDAMLVTAKLREEGWEAYIFHDQFETLVTIGGFDDLGPRMPDGHIELQSGIAKVIKKFEAKKSTLGGNGRGAVQPVSAQVALVPVTRKVTHEGRTYDVPLDVSPRLIQVPRQSIADVYRER
jgi:hypothetical protein